MSECVGTTVTAADVVDDDRHHLDAARPGADDRDALADEVDRRRRPSRRVVLLAAEVVASGDLGMYGTESEPVAAMRNRAPDRSCQSPRSRSTCPSARRRPRR
jgi:hypothetical protein